MAEKTTYLKLNDEIRDVKRVSLKDSFGDYRIVRKIYHKTDMGDGSLNWLEVHNSEGFYNIFVVDKTIEVSSVDNFSNETWLLNDINVDHVVYGKDYVYLVERNVKTHRFNTDNFTLEEDYKSENGLTILDVEGSFDGYIYLATDIGMTVIEPDGTETSYNFALESFEGETIHNFCVDVNQKSYHLTTKNRVIKQDFSGGTDDFYITPTPTIAVAKPAVDDTYLYVSTTSNSFLKILKSDGTITEVTVGTTKPQKMVVDDASNLYFSFAGGSKITKHDNDGNLIWEYDFGTGFTVMDYDVSFNRNLYVIAQDGTNYKKVKLNESGNEITSVTETHNDNANYALTIVPGKYGVGFWDEFIN